MSATLLERPSETPETLVPCANCPALQRVERELGELRREVSELRCEVGYWKSRHADAVKRNEQLAEELRQAKGEIRTLRDERFGRKSEKATQTDRSNDLLDPLESSVPSGSAARSPVRKDTADATILICRWWRSSSRCRRNRWPVRSAESRPR